jgi:hypothetical protein
VSAIVRDLGADYVDGGLIGPPPTNPGTTRLYLSGEKATEVAAIFNGCRVQAEVLRAGPFSASGLKLAYAAWTKIRAALVLATRRAAADMGLEQVLAAEWAMSQPDLADRHRVAVADAVSKGWRWQDEMLQIARTFEDVGQPGQFGLAAAEIFARYPLPENNTVDSKPK